MQALADDGRPLSWETFDQLLPESEGSQLTSWLDWRLASERMQQGMAGLVPLHLLHLPIMSPC